MIITTRLFLSNGNFQTGSTESSLVVLWIDSKAYWSLSAIKCSIQFKGSTSNLVQIFLLSLCSSTPSPSSARCCGCWACPGSVFNAPFLTPPLRVLFLKCSGWKEGEQMDQLCLFYLTAVVEVLFPLTEASALGAVPCPHKLLSIAISQIGKSGNRCQVPLLAGILNFVRGILRVPWPQQLTWLWRVESTHCISFPKGKLLSKNTDSSTLSVFLYFLSRVVWRVWGGEATSHLVSTGLVLLGSLSKARTKCQEQLVNLFSFLGPYTSTSVQQEKSHQHPVTCATEKIAQTSFTFTPSSGPSIVPFSVSSDGDTPNTLNSEYRIRYWRCWPEILDIKLKPAERSLRVSCH